MHVSFIGGQSGSKQAACLEPESLQPAWEYLRVGWRVFQPLSGQRGNMVSAATSSGLGARGHSPGQWSIPPSRSSLLKIKHSLGSPQHIKALIHRA